MTRDGHFDAASARGAMRKDITTIRVWRHMATSRAALRDIFYYAPMFMMIFTLHTLFTMLPLAEIREFAAAVHGLQLFSFFITMITPPPLPLISSPRCRQLRHYLMIIFRLIFDYLLPLC